MLIKKKKCLKKYNWIGIKITDSAACQIRNLLKNDSSMLGLRIKIKKSGCAGLGYKIEKVNKVEKNDQIYENNGAKLYVLLKILPFIDGTELDYVQEGINYVFKFNNPQAKNICGCGVSFNI